MSEEVRVFISYSHDSVEHRARVLSLSERLRSDGIDTILDRYVEGSPAEGWPRWMMNQLDCASAVLIVCTEVYYQRFLGREVPRAGRGVDWEGSLITLEQYGAKSKTRKFVPVAFSRQDEEFIPPTLRGQTFFTLDSESAYQSLCAVLLGQYGIKPRPVNPRVPRAAVVVEPMRFADAAPAEEQPRFEVADIHPATRLEERSAAVQESASPAVLSALPGGGRSGRSRSPWLGILAAASAVAVAAAIVGFWQPDQAPPSPSPSAEPSRALQTLAAKTSPADVAACSALLSELALSLVASAYSFGPESDGWAHECELSKYKPRLETRSPVDVIVQKRGGWEEHDPADVDPEARKTGNEGEDAEAPEEEWTWSLNTLQGARDGARLAYVAYVDGTPKALRVLVGYGAGNYCQSTPPREHACGSWGTDKQLWIFANGKDPAFQLNVLTNTLRGAFPDAPTPVSGSWFREGARLAFWGSSGVQLCGQLLDSSEDEAQWRLELWPAKAASGSLEGQCLKGPRSKSIDVLERD